MRGSGWGKNLESMKAIDEIFHRRIPFAAHHYHPHNDKGILRVLFERVRRDEKIVLSPQGLIRRKTIFITQTQRNGILI